MNLKITYPFNKVKIFYTLALSIVKNLRMENCVSFSSFDHQNFNLSKIATKENDMN